MENANEESEEYKKYISKNRLKLNRSFNKVLWICILVGPVVALGVYGGVFLDATYKDCILATVMFFFVALFHTIFIKLYPGGEITKYLVLASFQFTICVLCLNHIGVYLTFFAVPLISLMYQEKRTYFFSSIMSYVCMVVCIYFVSEKSASVRMDKDALLWFKGMIIGLTIEFFLMFLVGYIANKSITENMRQIYNDKITIATKDELIQQDSMTGLLNKNSFIEKFSLLYSETRDWILPFAFVFVDLDRFKEVNDLLGHTEGDKAIYYAAKELKISLGHGDLAGRYGGDEFVLLFLNIAEDALKLRLEDLAKSLRTDYSDGENTVHLSASMGVVYCEGKATIPFSKIIEVADKELYKAKGAGRDKVCVCKV